MTEAWAGPRGPEVGAEQDAPCDWSEGLEPEAAAEGRGFLPRSGPGLVRPAQGGERLGPRHRRGQKPECFPDAYSL